MAILHPFGVGKREMDALAEFVDESFVFGIPL